MSSLFYFNPLGKKIMQKTFLSVIVLVAMVFAPFSSAFADGKGTVEVMCSDSFYTCLNGEELKTFSGRTFKYKHPRAIDFGVVTVVLQSGGDLTISNAKGSSGGSWKIKDNVLELNLTTWKDRYEFRFLRINGRLFVIPNHATGGVSLSSVEMTE